MSEHGIKLQWIKDYHKPEKGFSNSGADLKGNCTRCGKPLPHHEAQDAHNHKVHLGQ